MGCVGTDSGLTREPTAGPVAGLTVPSRPAARLDPGRCSVRALARGDSPIATASPAQRWLLIEQPGPWGRDALAESRFDAERNAPLPDPNAIGRPRSLGRSGVP